MFTTSVIETEVPQPVKTVNGTEKGDLESSELSENGVVRSASFTSNCSATSFHRRSPCGQEFNVTSKFLFRSTLLQYIYIIVYIVVYIVVHIVVYIVVHYSTSTL